MSASEHPVGQSRRGRFLNSQRAAEARRQSPPRPRLQWRSTGGKLFGPQYPGDCGHDLVVIERAVLSPGEFVDLSCGVEIALPPYTWGLITGRSSTFRRKWVHVVTGIIDGGYRGPIAVGAWNAGRGQVTIEPGERLAQLIVLPTTLPVLEQVENLPVSTRGTRAFGSTGD